MSERMVAAGRDRGAVLIAGKGHARDDRGVPLALARDAPGKKVVTVAFAEVDDEKTDPAAYREDGLEGRAPYDFLVFIARTTREDPCAGIEAKMHAAHRAHEKEEAKRAAGGMDPSGAASTAPPAAPATGR
jgi:hypothetical protein